MPQDTAAPLATGAVEPDFILISRNVLFRTMLAQVLAARFPERDIACLPAAADLTGEQNALCRLIIFTVGPRNINELLALLRLRKSLPQPLAPFMIFVEEGPLRHDICNAENGCQGVICTETPVDIAIAAVQLVLAGGSYFPQQRPITAAFPMLDAANRDVTQSVHFGEPLNNDTSRFSIDNDDRGLTPRERQVLSEICNGHSNKVIARNLSITENTAKMHVRRILVKLEVKNRTEAAVLMGRHGR